jgi:hypothetical protein
MTADSIPRELLENLKIRQIAFLRARLTSDKAREEWQAHVAATWAVIEASPLAAVVDAGALADAIDVILSASHMEANRVSAGALLQGADALLRQERRALGDFVPEATRAKLHALLERPGMVPERFIREILEDEVTEAALHELLYEALTEFSDKVNPFFAEWGLPSLLKRLSPFGLGGMSRGFESMRAEFDKRLDPEIRKFLMGFSRKTLRNASGFILARSASPQATALRTRLLAWVLSQRPADILPDESCTRLAHEIGFDLAAHLASLQRLRANRRGLIDLAVRLYADRPFSDALSALGLPRGPEVAAAIAKATWPAVRAAAGSEPVAAWLAALVGEFYDEVAAHDSFTRGAAD